ncbi:MAG: iron-binding protein hemerythrin [Clostridiales bacterium]|nr:iron-binding protein hemerythrin [Clostridiales bacterium]
MYEMKEEYLTGIEFIDQEHTRLFEIADETYQLLKNDLIHDKYDYIVDIVTQLKDYTKMHFDHEEEYMRSINYKRMFTQKTEHDAFIAKLAEYDIDTIDDKQISAIYELVELINNWLIYHIFENDKLIGK